MIIQCEQCQTKFKLDDAKVADKSIKVRCARCRHVFSVAGTRGVPEDSAPLASNLPEFQFEEDQQQPPAAAAPETIVSFAEDTLPEEETSAEAPHLEAFSFTADEEQTNAPTPSAGDDAGISLPSPDSTAPHNHLETEPDSEAFDFGAFEFGAHEDETSEPAVTAPTLDFGDESAQQVQVPSSKDLGGLDFSGDDMFGEVPSAAQEAEAAEPISFDMDMDDFADSMGVESEATGQDSTRVDQEQTTESPFSLDEIDFGDELTSVAVQHVSTEELKPSQDLLFAPLAAAQTKPEFDFSAAAVEKAAPTTTQEEPPPLSISSRRKESPRKSGMLVFMGIIIAGLVIFYSYWGYMTLTENKRIAAQETGQITLRSVAASFVKNKNAGDLLVISGEAVNKYDKPRAAIQIKGVVYGAKGEEVSSKSVFCGNPLTKEQLSTLTMDKIEAAMANQFGDSLSNMEVAPGNAIPFVIVMPKPPAGATDYGVEPVGSTVATGGKEK